MTDIGQPRRLGTSEGDRWNELYARGIRGTNRPQAEIDSVPIPGCWGDLPPDEIAANEFLIDRAKSARRILDLGCGTGSILAWLLRSSPTASGVGIDASSVGIELGTHHLMQDSDIAGRMKLIAAALQTVSERELGRFDLIYALFSLQFLRPQEFTTFAGNALKGLLKKKGLFAGSVRSIHRSVPASYIADPAELNTYISYEPHEAGMVYHHYEADEFMVAAELLGGRLVYLHEKRNTREYDPAPLRAWWDFVIERP